MANTGDTFTVQLNQAQLEWGTFRFTGSRGLRYGEGYLKIPKHIARTLQLFNGNYTNGFDIVGENIFHATSADGLFNGPLRSEGCSNAGDPYAKQFAGDKNLMALGYWYALIIVASQVSKQCPRTYTGAFCLLEAHPQSP